MSDACDSDRLLNTIAELEKRLALQEEKLREQERIITERERTGQSLRKSEEMYHALFKNMLSGFACCRMLYKDGNPDDFIYLSVNDAVETLIGLKHAVGKRVTELVPGVKETDPELFAIFGRVAMTGQAERFEKYVEALQQWFSVSVYSPEKDHFAVVYDVITERKHAEQVLIQQKSAEQFRSLIESAPDAIIVQTDQRIAYMNPAACCLFGIESPDELLGQPVLDRVHPSMRAILREHIRLVSEERKSVPQSEHTCLRIDGSDVPVETSSVPIVYEGKNGALVFIRDISNRRQTEEKLRESEALFQSILNASPDIIAVTDTKGCVRTISRSALTMFGYSVPQDVRGQLITDYLVPEDRERAQASMTSRFQGTLTGPSEYRAIRPDGTVFDIESNAEVIRDAAGEPTGIVIITRDITERKRAEQALLESERNYREIFNATGEAIFLHDAGTGRLLDANDATVKMYGYDSKEDVLKGNIGELSTNESPYTQSEAVRRIRLAVEEGPQVFEWHAKKQNGDLFWVEVSLRSTKIGGEGRILAVVRDISERKRAEQALLESERNYREIFNATSEAIILYDAATGNMLDANDAKVKMYGYDSKNEVLKGSLADFSSNQPPYTQSDAVRWIRLAVEEGPQVFEWQAKKKNGDLFWVEVSLRSTQVGGEGRILAVIRNITERKRAEQALRESEQNYREIFNATNEAIFLHDAASGKILDVNDTTMRMFGCRTKDEIIESRPGELSLNQPPYTGQERIRRIHQAVEEGPQVFEWMARKKNGELFWVEVSLLSTRIGGKGRVLAVVHDINKRKRAEEEKEKLQAKLTQAQKMESIGRLAGGIAHDYNNMLNIIMGYTELSLYQVEPSDPLHVNLKEILNAAQRSADVTRKLLAFARKQIISPKVLNLNETIGNTIKTLRPLLGENIDLSWLPGTDVWSVKMDPVQVDQILVNLCVNSRDAIDGVDKITIKTGNITIDKAYCAEHEAFLPGDFVLLSVSDDGSGMDKETLEHVFEPFFTTKEMGQGTGLGMATVYGIVKQNNGVVTALSQPGSGTTVTVYLPRHKNPASEAKPEGSETIPRGYGETVLLVEDEEAILVALKNMLGKLGYNTLGATMPSEALRLAMEHNSKIDLLVTDVVMPEMNGSQLANRLHESYPDMKIVFMSGYTADVITSRGIVEEGVNFLQKPFTMKSLASKVRESLDKK